MDGIQLCIYNILADAVYANDNNADLENSDTLCVMAKNCNIMMTESRSASPPL